MMDHAAPARVSAGTHAIVALLSFAGLLAELCLTRLFSVLLWYHFAFLAISLALAGLSAGALLTYLGPAPDQGDNQNNDGKRLWRDCLLAGLSLAIVAPILLHLKTSEQINAAMLAKIVLACVIGAMPYVFIGAGLARAMRSAGEGVSTVYAADLLGAAMGCLLFVPLADSLGVPLMMTLAGGCCALAAFFAASGIPASRNVLALATLVVILVAGVGQQAAGLMDVQYAKGKSREDVDVRWNSFSRIGVWQDDKDEPFTRGISRRFTGSTDAERLIIDIDAGANTPMIEGGGTLRADQPAPASLDYLRSDLTSLAFTAVAPEKTLVIGPGGGRDVVLSLLFGARHVTGVEINPAIIDLVKNRYREHTGALYDRPDVDIVIRDGRSFLHSTSERFDVIMLSLVDTFAASAAGALSLTENLLYTQEAFEQYLNHLTPGGVVAFTRWVWEPDRETIRLVMTARTALERAGVDPARSIMVVQEKNLGSVLVGRVPFTEEQITAVERRANELGFTPVYLPGRQIDSAVARLMTEADPSAFLKAYPFDIRPATDDRPFFFFTLWPSDVFRVLAMPQGRAQNIGILVLLVVAVTVTVLAAATVAVPLMLKGRDALSIRDVRRGPFAVYFAALGLGFMLVEIPIIQSFTVFLGQPAAALAVVLFGILFGTSIGSAFSSRWKNLSARAVWLRLLTVMPVLFLLAISIRWASEGLLPSLAYWPMSVRAIVVIVLVVPFGACLGTFFPSGLTAVSKIDPRVVPWALGLNSICSVLGSVGAMCIGVAGGFTLTMAIGLCCYIAAILAFRGLAPRPPATVPTGA